MYKLADVLYEEGLYWVLRVEHGFEVYKVGITHSTRVASIGKSLGLDRAKQEITRRIANDDQQLGGFNP